MIALRVRTMIFAVLLLVALPLARAQQESPTETKPAAAADTSGGLTEYDVTSVKVSNADGVRSRWIYTPDGFSLTKMPLRNLVDAAYHIRLDLISGGPRWTDSTEFDIQAKVSGEHVETFKHLRDEQQAALLQALLVDRFKLKVRHEMKMLTMYDLVVAKGGPKLKAAAPVVASAAAGDVPDAVKPHGSIAMGPGMVRGTDVPMRVLTHLLASALHSTVVDKTGLTGEYDVDLRWTPDDARPPSGDGSAAPDVSIFTAVQEQLGLKLQPTKGPVDTLVIEHAEMPSEN